MRKWNFSPGPAVIPNDVLLEAQSEFLEFNNSGMSIMEMSHRTDLYSSIALEAKKDLIDILNVPENYEVLFLQGGATHQFTMIPMNFSKLNGNANYITTGTWSKRAFEEGSKIAKIDQIFSSEDKNFTYAPNFKDLKISQDASYIHYCPNETIQGVSFDHIPSINTPLIADMSSSILSEPIDISKFSLIYASAQKNIGPSGLTIVIIEKNFMSQANQDLTNLFKYSEHSKQNSMLNTPPTFSWYMAGKVFKWIKELGGLDHFKKLNNLKASKLYQFIDNSEFYINPVEINNRSIMNIPFTLKNKKFDSVFLKESHEAGLLNLKGHFTVGGMRASIYNAMPLEGVHDLIKFMNYFELKYN
ncbi:MAG: 3-phosphoserine/phosphohydroxythreonine aminotransferase [Gammaproteobacteria bacterium]|nr:3-phosphoserine/phosphohydroxythreonine aminotransferase [Gammaproteobacteria bacterium]|tara:strand:- start:58679 stop:59755 length:1077 start_codon:yes stop_codon:yes gene_type:complete